MGESSLFSNKKIDNQINNTKGSKTNTSDELIKDIANSSRRIKILEDRYLTIRKKTQLTDQNMLDASKKFNSEIRAINSEVNKLKILLKDMNEKIDQLITETSTLASRNDLTVLNKYVDFWKPMNFVTREQLDRELKYSKK